MKYTFTTDDCMVITIPLGNLQAAQDGQLMPDKFTCVFKDMYKVFLRGQPKALGVAQLTAGAFVICLGGILSSSWHAGVSIYTFPSTVFVVCGILTYTAGLSPSMHVMKISFVFNIICLFWAISTFVLVALIPPSTKQSDDMKSLTVGLRSVIILLHVLEFVLAAVMIFWESKAICRPHFNTLPMITLKQDM